MSEKRNQHYISQWYMKNFFQDYNTNPEKEYECIFYIKQNKYEHPSRGKFLKNKFCEKDFNTINQVKDIKNFDLNTETIKNTVIEDIFSTIESDLCRKVKNLICFLNSSPINNNTAFNFPKEHQTTLKQLIIQLM